MQDESKSVNESMITPTYEEEEEVRKTLAFEEVNTGTENEDDQTVKEDETRSYTIQTELQVTHNNEHDKTDAEVQNHISIKTIPLPSAKSVNFVLGDSNAIRIHVKDPDVKNISKTGQKAAEIDTLLKIAEAKASGRNVKSIIMHLGTNDISRCKDDSSQAMIDVSHHGNFSV